MDIKLIKKESYALSCKRPYMGMLQEKCSFFLLIIQRPYMIGFGIAAKAMIENQRAMRAFPEIVPVLKAFRQGSE